MSRDELFEAFDRLGIDIADEVDEIMLNMDIDGNGFIDYSELKLTLTDWNLELKEKNLAKVFNVEDGKMLIDAMRVDLIDIKQNDWIKFLRDCPNNGKWILVTDLKVFLKNNIEL